MGSQSQKTLKVVFVIARHGQRTPCFVEECNALDVQLEDDMLTHPNHTIVPIELRGLSGGHAPASVFDEAAKRSNFLKGGTCLPGQLTGVGAEAQFQIGKKLRALYVDETGFLSPDFKNEEIFVRCSNIRRTVLSARSILAGLYPSSRSQQIPIHVTTFEEEIIQPKTKYSLSFSNERLFETENAKALEKHFGEFLHTKGNVDLFRMTDNILSLEELGYKIPISETLTWKEAQEISRKYMLSVATGNSDKRHEALQTCVGPLLDFIMSKMQQVDQKLVLISGHDQTVIRTLYSVGIPVETLPPTNATVIIELFTKGVGTIRSQHVQIKYFQNGEVQTPDHVKELKFEDFDAMTSQYRLSLREYVARCEKFEENL